MSNLGYMVNYVNIYKSIIFIYKFFPPCAYVINWFWMLNLQSK